MMRCKLTIMHTWAFHTGLSFVIEGLLDDENEPDEESVDACEEPLSRALLTPYETSET